MRKAKLEIEEATSDRMPVVRLGGTINIENSPALRQALEARLKDRPAAMLVNLSKLERIDTSGLATLVECAQSLREHGGRLLVAGLRGEMTDSLSLSQVRGVFLLFDTERQALSEASAGTGRSGEEEA